MKVVALQLKSRNYEQYMYCMSMTCHLANLLTLREPELHMYTTRDDIPDMLVGILSQTSFKVMQKCYENNINFWYAMVAA